MQVKKSKPSPESKPEPPVPKQIPKPIPTVTTNHNADSKVQKSEQIISAEIKSETPKAKKGNSRLKNMEHSMWHIILVTKVSVTDDLEDELLEGGDDLELGNEIIDDDLFDLWSQNLRSERFLPRMLFLWCCNLYNLQTKLSINNSLLEWSIQMKLNHIW